MVGAENLIHNLNDISNGHTNFNPYDSNNQIGFRIFTLISIHFVKLRIFTSFIQLRSNPLQPTPGYSNPLQTTPGQSNPLQVNPTHSNLLQVTPTHSLKLLKVTLNETRPRCWLLHPLRERKHKMRPFYNLVIWIGKRRF